MNKFQTYLQTQAELISQELKKFISSQPVKASTLSWDITQQLKKFTTSGKVARGSLVVLGFDIFAKEGHCRPEVIKAALAIELAHSALLIQDDIMDQDGKRRGQQSIHKQNQQFGQKSGAVEGELYGLASAMCSSDLLFFWAYQLLNQLQVEAETRQRLIREFNHSMVDTVWGQIEDVNLAMLEIDAAKEDIFNVLILKSARYSLVNPLLCGAILAEADSKQLKALEKFAKHIGIVFQIRDDELSLLGQEAKTGKKVGNDIMEDKQTLHRYYLFERAKPQDKKRLQAIFGSGSISDSDLEFVQNKLKEYKVIRAIHQEIDRQNEQAEQALAKLKLSSQNQSLLQDLIEFINKREK